MYVRTETKTPFTPQLLGQDKKCCMHEAVLKSILPKFAIAERYNRSLHDSISSSLPSAHFISIFSTTGSPNRLEDALEE
jgi:hypothetical protein